ncbi:MAG: hypothetical protein ACR2QE_20095 [Acidimicrobiales bacterium]
MRWQPASRCTSDAPDETEPEVDTGDTSDVDDLEPAEVPLAIWIALAVVLLIAIGSTMARGRSPPAEDPEDPTEES